MTLKKELLEILACPKCKGELTPAPDESYLDCRACSLRYPVRNGIPVMLVEEAVPIAGT